MNKLILLFIIVPILGIVLLALNILLAPHNPDEAKNSIYECGYETVPGQTRSTFPIQFYLTCLCFLVFDVEVLFIFPIGSILSLVESYGYTVFLIFTVILTIGFVYEIGASAISIDKIILNKTETFKKNENN